MEDWTEEYMAELDHEARLQAEPMEAEPYKPMSKYGQEVWEKSNYQHSSWKD